MFSTDLTIMSNCTKIYLKFLESSDENLKITTPIDIELAESILRRRGGACPSER